MKLVDKQGDASGEPEAVRLWLRLLTCSITVEKRLRRRLAAQFQTTLPRFDVLAALDRNPKGMTMGDLSQVLLVSGGNLTALVRKLQRQGWVVMDKAPHDGRSWVVRISDLGRERFREIATEHHHWVGVMFGGLTDHQRRRLYSLLGELKNSLARESGLRAP